MYNRARIAEGLNQSGNVILDLKSNENVTQDYIDAAIDMMSDERMHKLMILMDDVILIYSK